MKNEIEIIDQMLARVFKECFISAVELKAWDDIKNDSFTKKRIKEEDDELEYMQKHFGLI